MTTGSILYMFMGILSRGFNSKERLTNSQKVSLSLNKPDLIGERNIKIGDEQNFDYKGELDRDGNACGFGVATFVYNTSITFTGTFYKHQIHGISNSPCTFDKICFSMQA